MILKIILVLLCGVLGLSVGVLLKQRLEKKLNYFNDLCFFCDYMKNDLTYKQTKLKLLIHSFPYKSKSFKLDIFNFVDNFNNEINVSSFLTDNEKIEVLNLLNSLGKVDINTQINLVNESKYRLEKLKNDFKIKFDKDANLYVKLGFLLGLSVGVLML